MGTVLQMYASAVPADAMVSIDVPLNGHLVGVEWTVNIAASAADFANKAQLSFGSTGALASNDARQVLSNVVIAADLTTSGAALTSVNQYSSLPDVPVNMGERLFVHGSGTAITMTVLVCLHFDFDLDKALVRRR